MKLTKKEKEALLELLDVVNDRVSMLKIERFTSDYYTELFWKIFKKLRFEVKGY